MGKTEEFRKAYLESQHPDVAALWDFDEEFARKHQNYTDEQLQNAKRDIMLALADKGIGVDYWIIGRRNEPLTIMEMRLSLGLKWVNPVGQPPVVVTDPSYDPDNPPKWALKVSTDPADFPKYKDPGATPPPLKSWVGLEHFPGAKRWYVSYDYRGNHEHGEPYAFGGVQYRLHSKTIQGMFGPMRTEYWVLASEFAAQAAA